MQTIMPVFKQWIMCELKTAECQITPLQGDASSRRYFRVTSSAGETCIAMLAPSPTEKTDQFVKIAQHWQHCGLRVPKIMSCDLNQGFVLLSDFGDELLLNVLNPNDAARAAGYYREAMRQVIALQKSPLADLELGIFDEAHIDREWDHFERWFLGGLLNLQSTPREAALLEQTKRQLSAIILALPRVTVHRDYHSRNLMVTPSGLGLIDFQDAIQGPITYDLASLLKDCYIHWPRESVLEWATEFYHQAVDEKLLFCTVEEFIQGFEWTGLKRHLRVLGIFSRLHLRDNKSQYLSEIPRIMNYILEVTGQYPALKGFDDWLHQSVLPPVDVFWQNWSHQKQVA